MIPDMVDKLAPNRNHSTRGLVKYVPGRGYFRAVPSQDGDKFVTSPPPLIVERVCEQTWYKVQRKGGFLLKNVSPWYRTCPLLLYTLRTLDQYWA